MNEEIKRTLESDRTLAFAVTLRRKAINPATGELYTSREAYEDIFATLYCHFRNRSPDPAEIAAMTKEDLLAAVGAFYSLEAESSAWHGEIEKFLKRVTG